MSKPYVVVTRRMPGTAYGRLEEACDVWLWEEDRPIPPALLTEKLALAEGLLCMLTDTVSAAMLVQAPRLKAISTMAVGVDHIDLAAAKAKGLPVGYTPDVVTPATADLAFALILAFSRRIVPLEAQVRRGEWLGWTPHPISGHNVAGKTLGIFGMGRIGQAVARRALGFSMPVVYHNRQPNPQAEAELGARYLSFDDLLTQADILVITAPLSPQTRGIFDAQAFARMKSSSLLVNVARGPLVNQADLREALVKGQIRGAALDVCDPEPMSPQDPLLTLPNCLVLPHVGTATQETRAAMAEMAVDNLLAAMAGQPMPHCINPPRPQ